MSTNGFRLFDGMGDALERVLDLRRMQHGLTAANLANAETPGYRAREIPFSEILADEVSGAEDGQPMGEVEVREIEPTTWALDGNSVSAEDEAVKLSSNLLMYDAVAAGMSKRLALLRFAASDGRS